MRNRFLIAIFSLLLFSNLQAQRIVEDRPEKPVQSLQVSYESCSDGYHWQEGQWTWNKRREKYEFHSGQCVKIKRGHLWIKGRWTKVAYGWMWSSGHWRKMM